MLRAVPTWPTKTLVVVVLTLASRSAAKLSQKHGSSHVCVTTISLQRILRFGNDAIIHEQLLAPDIQSRFIAGPTTAPQRKALAAESRSARSLEVLLPNRNPVGTNLPQLSRPKGRGLLDELFIGGYTRFENHG